MDRARIPQDQVASFRSNENGTLAEDGVAHGDRDKVPSTSCQHTPPTNIFMLLMASRNDDKTTSVCACVKQRDKALNAHSADAVR
mmetsp:Transcript_2546/g.4506  ORF Transcript_2546/g.4506 Transcript_2546/m.4506 type:complete len:85 (-) Transcript_2546:531-785(-)